MPSLKRIQKLPIGQVRLDHAAGSVFEVGASGSAVGRSTLMVVDPPGAAVFANNVEGISDEVFARCCLLIGGPPGFKSRAPKYNELIGGVRAAIDPIHLRNIKLGELAVDDR